MDEIDVELDGLCAEGIVRTDDFPRYWKFLKALEKFETNCPGGELPIYNERSRPKFAVGPEYQHYFDDVAIQAWEILRDGIAHAEKHARVLKWATDFIDKSYPKETSTGARTQMRDVVATYRLQVSEPTRLAMAKDGRP